MQGKQISHFRILSKIGEGGMGIVYRAEDEKLGRQVALKVLQAGAVGNEERRLRFLREARAAAAVNHPHIATIHEIDEVDGAIFIAMELIEGKTLAELIGGRPLPPRDSLRYAIEMAEAIAHAHAAGVVHRDLKPENIIVGENRHIKILDFGLAKIEEPPPSNEDATRMQTISAEMTQAGRVLGTPAYMSPEQARGITVDSRSDLFSFGIMLYEMVTGSMPFKGDTITDTLLAIVRDEPAPLLARNPNLPPEMERIVSKCLEKAPEDRYQHADDIVVDLRRLRRQTESQGVDRVSTETPRATVPKPFPLKPVLWGAGALMVLVAAIFLAPRFGVTPARGDVQSLAVMPLQNLRDQSDPERLGQILQELIITDLSELGSLTVLSSQRLFDVQEQLGSESATINRELASEVAARADATTMLTGTLSKLEDRWIMTCQLVNVDDGSVLISERVDGTDLYTMVDDMTGRIRNDLGLLEGASEGLDVAVKNKTTSSIEAYQHYLAGVDYLNVRDYKEAALALKKAIDIDPKFGAAYYKLAITTWWLDDTSATWVDENGIMQAEEILDFMLGGELKLSAKERKLAAALKPLVSASYQDAREPYRGLVTEYPDEKEGWYGLGEAEYHAQGGSFEASLNAFERALELDPSFMLAYTHIFDMYERRRLHSEAASRARTLIRMEPQAVTWHGELIAAAIRGGDPQADALLEESLNTLTDPGDKRELLQEAARRFRDTDNQVRERECLEQALGIETEEREAEILGDLGLHFANLYDHETATEYYLRGFEANPERFNREWALADLYRKEGRFADGILRFRAWTLTHPGVQGPPDEWIRMAVFRGDEQEIARALETSIEQEENPAAVDRYPRIAGDAYRHIGNFAKARAAYEQALELDPDHVNHQADAGLAHVDIALRNYAAAETRIREIIEDDGMDFFRRHLLSRCLILSRKHEEALTLFTESTVEHSNVFTPQRMQTLIAAGRLQKAEALIDSAQGALLPPEYRNYLRMAGYGYLDSGYLNQAETLFRRAAETPLSRESFWSWEALAYALIDQGRLDEAEKAIARLREIHSAHRRIGVLEADVELARGNPARAEALIQAALQQGPDAFMTSLLIPSLIEQGKYRQAHSLALAQVEHWPIRENYVFLAWILIAGDIDVQEGVSLAERALGMPESGRAEYPRSYRPSARHCLGLAYLKQGEREKARSMLQTAATERPDRTLIQTHLKEAQEGA